MNVASSNQLTPPQTNAPRPSLNRTVSYYSSIALHDQSPKRKKTTYHFPGFEEIIRTESTLHLSLTPKVAL
ncbi:hypothetical protein K493DRAFT_313342 [Basidiobolus meristosporus CBS 931.73]|uniref:Uncharacterized protein n=1 Tax=Basidiobolus meristosporus CBS 931.73 TaxID=1314790 RepID=A0A1Y1YM70_9FUNG|nr:hypothetical protein K493DRAFT_313342 [Basidiobolus meristosporus CBS 931.73]|eukprot:ORX99102.1 hypothetical protein K493DRAFT_313342 [Basidiobolus meristosporus CBS 931.73]